MDLKFYLLKSHEAKSLQMKTSLLFVADHAPKGS